MTPGDNCPECDRRLQGDSCSCGWKASGKAAGPNRCSRCPTQDVSVRHQDGRYLCATCRLEIMRINAASDDDLTESGETVGQVRARFREILRANAHKWGSKREGPQREVSPL